MTKSLEIYRSTRTTVIKAGRVSSHRGSLPFLRYLHKFHPKYLSAFDEKAIQGEELYQKLMLDKLEVNTGMLVENIVAQMFVASGHKLYFYSNNYTITSLQKFIKKFNRQLATPIVVHYQDYQEKDGITYLPIYMVPLL